MRRALLVTLAGFVILLLQAQEKKAKISAPSNIDQTDGAAMYKAYCATCHGVSGKGGGPVAEVLKVAPTDLTRLKSRAGGTFPAARVRSMLRGSVDLKSHGTNEMPIWGSVFRIMSYGDSSNPELRIENLVKHVETLQR